MNAGSNIFLTVFVFASALHGEKFLPPEEIKTLPKSGQSIIGNFKHSVKTKVDALLEKKIGGLNQNYNNALEKRVKFAQSQGDLKSVRMFQSEQKLLANQKGIPLWNSNTSPSLRSLRQTYHSTKNRMVADSKEAKRTLVAGLLDNLAKEVSRLTRAGSFNDAEAIDRYIPTIRARYAPEFRSVSRKGSTTSSGAGRLSLNVNQIGGGLRKSSDPFAEGPAGTFDYAPEISNTGNGPILLSEWEFKAYLSQDTKHDRRDRQLKHTPGLFLASDTQKVLAGGRKRKCDSKGYVELTEDEVSLFRSKRIKNLYVILQLVNRKSQKIGAQATFKLPLK